MQPDPKNPSTKENPLSGSAPPPSPAAQPPVIEAAPPLVAGAPPPLPLEPAPKAWSARRIIAFLLSVCLGLFLADAVFSLVDASLNYLFGVHFLIGVRWLVNVLAVFMGIATYGLMAFAPMIPKRLFLPVALFNPASLLVSLPFAVYAFGRLWLVDWVGSLCQVILGLGVLCWLQRGFKFRWPLVAQEQLKARRFSWRYLSVFLLVNVFILPPGVIAYLVLCAGLAIDHYSEGFVALRPAGLTMQARKYVRADGKTIQLFPMSHVGEPDFYRKLAQSFPSNSIILMEGVTDNRNLMTNEVSYKRMATSLGVAEQQEEFNPTQGEMVWADVDLEQFTTNTIGFLNLIMLVHCKGVNAETVLKLMRFSPPPHLEMDLLDDLLLKRNRRVLEELHAQLAHTEHIIVPWGVAHMPGIAAEIQKAGFRLDETREFVAIRFHVPGDKAQRTREEGDSGKPK